MRVISRLFIAFVFFNMAQVAAIKLPFDFFQDQQTDTAPRAPSAPIVDQVKVLENDLAELTKKIAERNFNQKLTDINKAADGIKRQLEKQPLDEFLTMELSIYNKMYQTILEIEQTYKDIQAILEKHIKMLSEYQEDPHFKKLKVELKTYYTFDELLKISHQLQEYEDRLAAAQEKSKMVSAELPSRKKKLSIAETDLKNKQKQREELLQGADIGLPAALKQKEQGEMVDMQLKLLELKKEAAQAKVEESERRIAHAESQRFILQDEVRVLKGEYARVKGGVRVDDAYVKKMQASVDKKRGESLRKVMRYTENIEAINSLQEELGQELVALSNKYQIAISDLPLADWTGRKDIDVAEWVGSALITKINEQISTYESSEELIQAQSDLEEYKLKASETLFDIVESWHKMTNLKKAIDTDEELRAEIKKYDGAKAELRAEMNSVNERLSSATSNLTTLHSALDEVKARMQALKKQKDGLFKDKAAQYDIAAKALSETEETIRTRIDAIAKLIETYSAQQSAISGALKEIELVVKELSLKDFWQPSAQAIDWAAEINRIIPDIKTFLGHMQALQGSYTVQAVLSTLAKKAKDLSENYWQMLLFIINAILIGVAYFLLKLYLPDGRDRLFAMPALPAGRYRAALFGGFLLGFIEKYLIFIYPWFVIWLLIELNVIYDTYFIILFYLASVPLFIFVFNRFFAEFAAFNKKHEYVFLSESYEGRFTLVVSWLFYALSAIMFFRSAFIPVNYHQSNLPTVLLAIAVILCQISAILLISREQILRLIPGKTEFGAQIKQLIDRYYFVIVAILFGIIVMSNPYVGFFRQVSYILSRLLITAIAIPLFFRLHNFLKNKSSSLFFYTEGETFKERFPYAKAAYGLMVIMTFLAFVAVSILALSRLWDYPIQIEDITRLLQEEIMPSPGLDSKGDPIRITSWSLLQVLAYIGSGALVVFFINRMVLGRLFDLLLVNVGVQNTLVILIRYFVLSLAFILGLQSVHLGYLMNYIGAALIALGFAIRDPVSDVICYFVILVQRPIKIGDYISLGEELSGVVRQITPRSVILRKNNSVTLVVPNSQLITRPIVNWNYVPTYFAFKDIIITVSYEGDPKKVQRLIFEVLDEQPNILKSPAPVVRLENFAENGYEFLIRGFVSADKTLDQWEIQSQVRLNIVKKLEENDIELAVPARILKVVPETLIEPFQKKPKE